jgi:hypothetical protein
MRSGGGPVAIAAVLAAGLRLAQHELLGRFQDQLAAREQVRLPREVVLDAIRVLGSARATARTSA